MNQIASHHVMHESVSDPINQLGWGLDSHLVSLIGMVMAY